MRILKLSTITAALTLIIFQNIAAQDYQEFAIVRDLSASQVEEISNFNTLEIISKTILPLQLESNGKGYGFYTSCIGQDAYPIVDKVKLNISNYWITPKEKRKSTVEKAKSETIKHLDEISILKPKYNQSSLYRGILHTISQMHSNCKKTVYVFSDGVEASYVTNFYNIKDWNKEYEQLKTALLTDTSVPKVINLEIVFICSGRDELTVKAMRFWKKFFSEFKISISTRASI